MKAAVLYELDRALRVREDVTCPPPGHGQVAVRMAYSGVCHSQLMEVRGRRGPDPHLPHLLGHEGSGRVEAIGPGVSKVAPGDRVVLTWIRSDGLDGGSVRYRCPDGALNAGAVTTFNEQAVVSENRCVKLPEGVPMDVAVLFGCALPTGAGIVMNEIRPTEGSTLAVFGLGGIGLSALMASTLFSCSKVIAIDVNPEKLALARDFGATHAVNAAGDEAVRQIRALTGDQGTDYSVDATGSAAGIVAAFNAVRRGGGLCVFASHPASGEHISLDPYELICGKRIQGSWGGAARPDEDIPRLAALYREGRLPLEKLISKRYRLEDINQALEDLEQRRVARPVLEIDPTLERGRG